MDTHDINCIRKIYETGSITKASNLLYISPQALSKRLKKIEAEIGHTLFERTPVGVSPTTACIFFYNRSEELYRNFHSFMEEISKIDVTNRIPLKVASSLGVMALITPDAIQQFCQAYPQIDLEIKEYPDKTVDQLVKERKVDIGLAIEPIVREFTRFPLQQYPFCALISKNHKLSEKANLSYQDLLGLPISMMSREFKVNQLVRKTCQDSGFNPTIYYESTELQMAHSLAEQNKCITISVLSERFLPKSDQNLVKNFRSPIYWSIVGIKKQGDKFQGLDRTFMEYISNILSNNE